MAKFIPGPLVSEIRNALGAQVFSRNQWGAYTRARVSPDQTETPDRLTAKEAMLLAAEAWQTTLTESQRVAWNAFAASMQVKARSPIHTDINGVALFIKLWILSLWWSGNSITDPPNDLDTPQLELADLTSDGTLSELIVTFAPSPVPAGQLVMVYATPPLNPGVSRPYRWFKPVTMFPPGTTSPQNIWTDYEAAHGSPIPGKKIFSRCKMAHDYNNFPSVPLQSATLVIGDPDAMLIATAPVTAAQMLTLTTVPKQIIAAPGVGKAIAVVGAWVKFIAVTTSYLGFQLNDLALVLGGILPLSTTDSLGLINSAIDNFGFFTPVNSSDPVYTAMSTDLTNAENKPLELWNWIGPDFTLGDGTLEITVAYAIIDV